MRTKRRGRITFPASTTIQLPELLSRVRRICHITALSRAAAWHCCDLHSVLLGKKTKLCSYFSHTHTERQMRKEPLSWLAFLGSRFAVRDEQKQRYKDRQFVGIIVAELSHLWSSPASNRCSRCSRTRRIYKSRFEFEFQIEFGRFIYRFKFHKAPGMSAMIHWFFSSRVRLIYHRSLSCELAWVDEQDDGWAESVWNHKSIEK